MSDFLWCLKHRRIIGLKGWMLWLRLPVLSMMSMLMRRAEVDR